MQINKYQDIYGGYTREEMAEGRFCYLCESDIDGVYGVRLPTSEAEAGKAGVCVAWPPTNQSPPFYTPIPSETWSLRQGFDKDANLPFDSEVAMTYPGFKENSTIPSGTLVRLFPRDAVVTLTSGNFVASSSLEKGAPLKVSHDSTHKGKPEYDASGTIAIVEDYDEDAQKLTVRIRY